MKRVTRVLLSVGLAYSILFILSVVFIVPRYLSGGLVGFLVALITDAEPEDRLLASFYSPLIWTLIPLTSMGLCFIAWISYTASTKMPKAWTRLSELVYGLSFGASFIPAILVVRELLLYSPLGVTFPGFVGALTNLALLINTVVNPAIPLENGGVWVVPIVVFVETGLFFGFFLPGDSLLLTAGVLGAVGDVNLTLVILSSIAAAIIGDQVGYATGSRLGDVLGHRYQFVRENSKRASEFYSKHGGKAIVLARFVPVVRTFAPLVAGAAKMRYSRFTAFNMAGGVFWVVSVTLAGYILGRQAPIIADYLSPFILVVIISSPLVWMLTWVWGRRSQSAASA